MIQLTQQTTTSTRKTDVPRGIISRPHPGLKMVQRSLDGETFQGYYHRRGPTVGSLEPIPFTKSNRKSTLQVQSSIYIALIGPTRGLEDLN